MFESLWSGIKHNIATLLTSVQIERNEDADGANAGRNAGCAPAPAMTDVLGESRTDLATEAFDPTGNDFSPKRWPPKAARCTAMIPVSQRVEIQTLPRQIVLSFRRLDAKSPISQSLQNGAFMAAKFRMPYRTTQYAFLCTTE